MKALFNLLVVSVLFVGCSNTSTNNDKNISNLGILDSSSEEVLSLSSQEVPSATFFIWTHNTEDVTFITEPSNLPVALVTGDLSLPGTSLQRVQIPLAEYTDEIVNNPEYWTLKKLFEFGG